MDAIVEAGNAALFELAETVLPGAGLGGYALPEDIRFVFAEGAGARAPASAAMPCRRISVSSLPKAPGRGCGTSRGGTTSTTSAARAR
jgi:hypothetical protein